MKLLFLAHRIPYPPNKGDKIRSYHELRALSERGHEIHLMAFADDLRDLNYQVELAKWCASVQIIPLRKMIAKMRALACLLTARPLSLGYFGVRKMKQLVKRALDEIEFDAIFVYSSSMAQYVPDEWRSRTVVDLVDVDSEKWRDYARRSTALKSGIYNVEAERLRNYEYKVVSGFAHSILTTDREAALLDKLDEFTRRARLRTITNGVDLDYFQAAENVVTNYSKLRWNNPRLVFTGAMDYFANAEGVEWFSKEVFPLIRQQESRAEFYIVGNNPGAEVKALGRLEGVTVTGFVEDIRPYLEGATACVIPLRVARGVQNKMLEAMATGRAVVASPEAAAGLRVKAQDHLLVAGTANEFAEAVIRVIRDDSLRNRLSWNARRFVEIEHDWHPLLQKLVELVESAGQRRWETESRNVRAIARH